MEPVTHLLTGAILARTGFNRRAAYATAAMVVAAELPDIDTVWSFAGPLQGFEHHRGITHTFLGLPFEAAAVTAGFYLLHRVLNRTAKRPTKAPPNWLSLYCASLVALLSHIFLDWTNNYGVRPFFPFNPHWYAGSFVFIFEPVMFVLLVGGLIAPSLFGLINAEVGARAPLFRGRGWAIATLIGVCILWTTRFIEHDRALQLATQTDAAPLATRFSASPYPVDIFRWHVVADTPSFLQLYTIDTRTQTIASRPNAEDIFYKSAPTVATLIAKRGPLGEIYLDWSQYPIVSQETQAPDPGAPAAGAGLTPVTFRDARFLYDTFLNRGRSDPPLSATVFVNLAADNAHRIDHTEFNGKSVP
jgi:inner membrane protein